MRYQGGKYRLAKHIAPIVNEVRGDRDLWDPFCGGLSCAVAFGGVVACSDAHPALIAMYRAVAAGWDPPRTLSRAEWERARELPDSDPRKAFAGFGCSFGGMWFHSYAENRGPRLVAQGNRAGSYVTDDYCAATRKALLRDVPRIVQRGGFFFQADFLAEPATRTHMVIYCDPPYEGTTGYAFGCDRAAFVTRCLEWAALGVDVFVSEYEFPIGRVVWEAEKTHALRTQRGTRTERLFHVEATHAP